MKQGQFINMETVGPVRMDAIAVGAAMGILRQQEWDVMELLRTEDTVAWGQGTEANPVQMKQGQFINMETVGPVRMDAIAVGAAMGILRQQEWDVMELLRTEDTVAWGQGT